MKKSLLVWAVVLASLPGLSLAAGKEPAKKAISSDSAVASVGKWKLTAKEVDQDLAGFIYDLELQAYKQRTQLIQEKLGEQILLLETAEQNISREALLKREVFDKVPEVSAEDVKRFIDQNRDRLPKSDNLENMVRRLMRNNLRERRFDDYIVSLGQKYGATVDNPPPQEPVFKVEAPADVSRGPATAPVTIVEFSDFECPYCKRAAATLKEVENLYGNKVRITYRNYLLPSHGNALNAAEASLCAAEQKKFWEYHDILFENIDKLGMEDLKKYAERLNLDTAKFGQCMDSNRNLTRPQKDMRDAARQGVTGTPTFFINGKRLVGAQPISEFQRVIDAELAKKKK
ncbi:MAG: DsbA family protein [Magnetococcales bacterium]|nr:DsbA family protein [Magnetococcales bacterium]